MPANHVKGPAVPLRGWISAVFSLLLLCCTRVEKLDLTRLTLPPGFHIAIFAEAPHARQMAFSPGGVLLVTADHGNAEKMIDYNTGEPYTAHTIENPVPLIIVDPEFHGKLREQGALANLTLSGH